MLISEKLYAEETQNKYTQTEAHLHLGKIRKLIKTRYDDTIKSDEKPLEMYLDTIAATLAKEGEFKKTHYVFYHGQTIEWRILQDLYRKLYEKFSPNDGKLTNFEFLRFEESEYTKSPTEFLQEQMKGDEGYDLINDNEGNLYLMLLSGNLSLFGNVGFEGECSWEYFTHHHTRKAPNKALIEKIFDTFGIGHAYVDDIMNLNELLQITSEQQLFQIFVPKKLVDTIAYLAFTEGIPADRDALAWVEKNLPQKFSTQYTQFKKKLDKLRETIQKEGEKNKLFANLLERIDNEDFSVAALLKTYCNTPETIENINYLQARLLFTKNILLNPFTGIKIFRYTRLSKKQEAAYQAKLAEIMGRIIRENKKTPPAATPKILEQGPIARRATEAA